MLTAGASSRAAWAETADFTFDSSSNYEVSDGTKVEVVVGMVSVVGRLRQIPLVDDTNTVLLLHLDNNVTDASSYLQPVVNNASVSFTSVGNTDFLQGYTADFGGTNFLSIEHALKHAELQRGSGAELSIECWIKSDTTTGARMIVDMPGTDGGRSNYLLRVVGTDLEFWYYGGGGWRNTAAAWAIGSTTTWYHVVVNVVFSTGSNVTSATFYVTPGGDPSDMTTIVRNEDSQWTNGGAGVPATLTLDDHDRFFAIGRNHYDPAADLQYWDGRIDELRISNVVRDPTEFSNRYDTTKPWIRPTGTNEAPTMSEVTAFKETVTYASTGSIGYKISADGTSWYYWNGAGWTSTLSTNTAEMNSAEVVNTNIAQFDDDVPFDNGTFTFMAFLTSDGVQKVELDNVEVTYTPPTGGTDTDDTGDTGDTDDTGDTGDTDDTDTSDTDDTDTDDTGDSGDSGDTDDTGDTGDTGDTDGTDTDDTDDTDGTDTDDTAEPGDTDGDHDGDGWTEDDSDCDDNDPSVYPGAPEQVDAVDQNCDGWDDPAEEVRLVDCATGAGVPIPPFAWFAALLGVRWTRRRIG